MRRSVTLALLSTILALLVVLAYPPVKAEAAVTPTATEKQVIKRVNAQRALRGLAPVRFASSLTRAARSHSREMAKRRVLTHTSANGYSVARRLIRFGYTPRGYRSWSVGECIARAKTGSTTATATGVVAAWMRSSAHRAVILKSKWRNVGVGFAYSSDGRRYMTIDFGRRIR